MDILLNLLTLENLVFENMVLSDNDSERHRIMCSKLNSVTAGQLKSLSLLLKTRGKNGVMEKYNRLFDFVSKSCPFIQEFKLLGAIGAPGALTLDFRHHSQLKCIEIDLKGCRYYTFNSNFDIKWKNFGKSIL